MRAERAIPAAKELRRRPASLAARSLPFARISVTDDPRSVAGVWHEIEAAAPVSPYQTLRWIVPWLATEGAETGVTPMIVIAYDEQDVAIALLPLGVRPAGPLRVASFLGGKHSNYNMGLFRPGPTWSEADILSLLRQAARMLDVRLDLYAFTNQPHGWMEHPNPLALHPGQPSPSFSHRAMLPADPDEYFRIHHSAHTRKLLRKKRAALEKLGPVSHVVGRSPGEIAAILDAFAAQKTSKLVAMGLWSDIEAQTLRALLDRAASRDGELGPAVEIHALRCGDRIVATFGGLAHAGRFSGLLNSYEASVEIARSSPGELLLNSVIAMKCREGFTSFDLGVGEARYKDTYCRIADPLFDSFLALTTVGRLYVVREATRLRLKGAIKRSHRAWSIVRWLRRLRLRRAASP